MSGSNNIMPWAECEKCFIRRVGEDKERIKSIVKNANRRLSRARDTKESGENISFIVEDYYEAIKELLIAYLLKNGLRSKNHQCLISYFAKENPNYEREAIIIQQMSFFRNRLNYYGEEVPSEFLKTNKNEFEGVIKLIKQLIEENG